MRRADLEIPFRGVRSTSTAPDADEVDAFELQARQRRLQARRYAPRMRANQFFSHETAAALWGGPLPLILEEGIAVEGGTLPVHVSTLGSGPLVRARGVAAHRADPRTSAFVHGKTVPLATPDATWAQLGALAVDDLVALGDYFCRVWRPGPGRKDAGMQPFTTIDALRARIASGRRVGIRHLREAIELIREDSWSPRESRLRCMIVRAGLPEPKLNHDVHDAHGRFIGCVDLAYPERRVAIEYHGAMHASTYARDVERIAALRAAGWTVIEVTSVLFARPIELIARIRKALA